MKRTLLTLAGLVVLIFLLDQVYRFIYPQVDLLRACLVGLTALAVLFGLSKIKDGLVNPFVGALSIFASAFLSVLLIQAGLLASQSTASGLVHVGLLAGAYLLADAVHRRRQGEG